MSHHTHLSGHPVIRTNVQGRPDQVDSPWIEWKISVIRRKGTSFSVMRRSSLRLWATRTRAVILVRHCLS